MLFDFQRILGTPTEKNWPGVSQLQDYKPNFPRWSGEGLRKAVPQLDNNGLDLLEVLYIVHAPDSVFVPYIFTSSFLLIINLNNLHQWPRFSSDSQVSHKNSKNGTYRNYIRPC